MARTYTLAPLLEASRRIMVDGAEVGIVYRTMGGEWVAVLREPWPPLAGGGARVRTAATAEVAVEAVLA